MYATIPIQAGGRGKKRGWVAAVSNDKYLDQVVALREKHKIN